MVNENELLEAEKPRRKGFFESIQKGFQKGVSGYQKGVTAYKTPAREREISRVARKAVYLAAPKGSLVKIITQPKKKKGKRGRGRPRETYKVRVLPSGKVVKVPTHIYKKMLAAEKAQMRLLRVQAQMQAEQLAMQQDMRYQPSAEDQFLEEPDQAHEMELMRARQLAEMEGMEPEIPLRPSVGRRIVRRVGDFGRGVSRIGRPQPPQIQRPIIQPFQRPQPRGMELRSEPRVTAVSGRASLLNVSNRVNNPNNLEQSMLTSNKEINFFSNRQPMKIPDRSKSFKIMGSQHNR